MLLGIDTAHTACQSAIKATKLEWRLHYKPCAACSLRAVCKQVVKCLQSRV